jgi:hypothetical protein
MGWLLKGKQSLNAGQSYFREMAINRVRMIFIGKGLLI